MLNNNNEFEQDLENNNSKDEEVQINVSHKKKRFDTFRMKYKKDKKKYLVIMVAMLIMLSTVVGTSYAYLRGISKTNNSVVISAGTIALTFQNDENVLDIYGAVPMSDEDGLAQSTEYSFDVKNNGTIPAVYTITLDNTCEAGNGIDLCIPDQYIKVGIKTGNEEYKVLEKKDQEKYIIETGELQKGQRQTYKMKIWLDYNTPNTYNAVNDQVIAYKGKLGLTYKQGKDDGSRVIYMYPTNVISIGDSIETQTHEGYCLTAVDGSDSQNYCDIGYGFNTEADCLETLNNDVSNGSCSQGTWTTGITNYTTDYTTLNKQTFIKYIISKEGIVESASVCLLLNNNLVCLNGSDGSDYSENKNLMLSVFGNSNCTELTTHESCIIQYESSQASAMGLAFVNGDVQAAYSADPATQASDYCGYRNLSVNTITSCTMLEN